MDKNRKSVVDSINLFKLDNIENHLKLLKTDSTYASHHPKFSKGQKLFLEIEVIDPDMASWLFDWMYRKDSNKEKIIPFGCEMQSIHFNTPGIDEFKQKLNEFLNEL